MPSPETGQLMRRMPGLLEKGRHEHQLLVALSHMSNRPSRKPKAALVLGNLRRCLPRGMLLLNEAEKRNAKERATNTDA